MNQLRENYFRCYHHKCVALSLSICQMNYALLLAESTVASLNFSKQLMWSNIRRHMSFPPSSAPGLQKILPVYCKIYIEPFKMENISLFMFTTTEKSNELNFNWIIKMLTQFHAIANKKRVGKIEYTNGIVACIYRQTPVYSGIDKSTHTPQQKIMFLLMKTNMWRSGKHKNN